MNTQGGDVKRLMTPDGGGRDAHADDEVHEANWG
jgi:hypothetical protein